MSRRLITLKNKNILLGITGGIAAYKSAMLVRLLVKEGANVKVIMSKSAKDFITPLTMATLSQNPILVDGFDPENGAWNSHINLGMWADYYLIAPATANTIAKMKAGIADNLLLSTYLSARCPVGIAPAMDYDMYLHITTQDNIDTLSNIGVDIIEPEEGFLASGLIGKGRMAEPEEIIKKVIHKLTPKPLSGRKVVITAGATVEPIDPVRFISNYSTGKMGYAIADTLNTLGAEVTLISGAATAILKTEGITLVKATSAKEMYEACDKIFPDMSIGIFTAAVADFTPRHVAESKIKSDEGMDSIDLVASKDIAAEMGKKKRPEQMTICFALETDNEKENAIKKLNSKNADAIVLNSLKDSGAGFGTDTNKITIFTKEGESLDFTLKSKEAVAEDIAELIINKSKA